MTETTVKRKIVGNALIWAAMMIASAILFKGQDGAKTLLLLFIAGWFATNSLIAGPRDMMRAECATFRRIFGLEQKGN